MTLGGRSTRKKGGARINSDRQMRGAYLRLSQTPSHVRPRWMHLRRSSPVPQTPVPLCRRFRVSSAKWPPSGRSSKLDHFEGQTTSDNFYLLDQSLEREDMRLGFHLQATGLR